jgi:DNA repair protein RadC
MTLRHNRKPDMGDLTNTVDPQRNGDLFDAAPSNAEEDAVIKRALEILAGRVRQTIFTFTSPDVIKQYLIVKYSQEEREIFSVLWLDVKHRLIEHETCAFGTLSHCSVYPRELVKSALRLNAAGAVLVHNHPSGQTQESDADVRLTKAVSTVLNGIDVKVVDHFIVAGVDIKSFAEHGLI